MWSTTKLTHVGSNTHNDFVNELNYVTSSQNIISLGTYLVSIYKMCLNNIQASFNPHRNFDQVIKQKLDRNIPEK